MTTMELEAGAVFGGDFTIVRPLRVGGMGAVYVAEQRSTGAKRALKLMQRELVTDPGLRERFEQEARIGATIESDHVVQVVAAGIDVATDVPWIAMELLEGMPLDEYLAHKGARPAGEVRFLFEQLCHALAAAHAKGVVHRDLKPANVFLCTPRIVGLSYVVKVLDFGIAKVLAEAQTARTAAVGTPMYMAPEQYEAGRVTPATDVWALGLIAFELLTGKSYWKGATNNPTPASIMYETCLGELSPASQRASDAGAKLPEGFDTWFGRCVERKPEARFADARAACDALAEVLGASAPPTEPLLAPPVSIRTPQTKAMTAAMTPPKTAAMTPPTAAMTTEAKGATVLSAPATAVAPRPGEGAPREKKSRTVAAAIYLAGAAIVATMILVAGLRKSDPPPDEPEAPAKHATPGSASAPHAVPTVEPHHFTTGSTVVIDGRTLHSTVPASARTETYVMLDVRGTDKAPGTSGPVHLALVLDRSGSMKGGRLDKAIAAAKTAIDRLRDGDHVTVVAFDQTADTIVPTTVLSAATRAAALEKVKKLTLGGDTCMSCGIATAVAALSSSTDTRRVLVLSDGAANVGVKDVAGFEKLAREAQKSDINITTIGVGDDYDPRALTALARESNGQHYYAENEAALPAIFDAQATAMANAVATATEVTLRLSPGVELLAVLDRAHRKEGSTVHVPLGQLVKDERKTVLLKVAVSPGSEATVPLCDVSVVYKDLLSGKDGSEKGALAIRTGAPGPVDAIVEARVHRSETAAALLEANKLFAEGKTKAADDVLAAQQKKLETKKKTWTVAPPAATAAPGVKKDLDDQAASVAAAQKGYNDATKSPAPAAAPPAKKAANKAAAEANAYGY